MPTREELKSLYKMGTGTNNMTPLLKTTGVVVWSGGTKDSSDVWAFFFNKGWVGQHGCFHGEGMFPARNVHNDLFDLRDYFLTRIDNLIGAFHWLERFFEKPMY